MSQTTDAAAGVDDTFRTVRLQVPLRDEYASTLRVVVASLSSDAGFTVDDIDDLRLAVSEVFSSIVQAHRVDIVSAPGATADVAIDAVDGRVAVSVSSSIDELPRVIDLDDLARAIITAAVDEFAVVDGVVTLAKHSMDSSSHADTPR
ncbi:MAG: hypothetical protein WBP59_09795 [Ilumatobacteraceae bacterium]